MYFHFSYLSCSYIPVNLQINQFKKTQLITNEIAQKKNHQNWELKYIVFYLCWYR